MDTFMAPDRHADTAGQDMLRMELAMLEGRVQVAVPPALVRQSAGLAADCGGKELLQAFGAHADWFQEAARGHVETEGWTPSIVLTEADVAGALQRLSRAAG